MIRPEPVRATAPASLGRRNALCLAAGAPLLCVATAYAAEPAPPPGGLPSDDAGAAPNGMDRHATIGWRQDAVSDVALPAAASEGLFSAAWVDPALVATDVTGAGLLAQLEQGRIDAAVAPALLLLDPLRRGLDAKLTMGVSGGGLRLLADRHSKLRHIEDVRKRRVGVLSDDAPAKLFFSILARRKGIDPYTEIEWVVVPPEHQVQALRTQEVDAIAAPDPFAFRLLHDLSLVEVATNISGGYVDRTYSVLACSGRLLRERPELALAITSALHKAAQLVGAHPDRAVRAAEPYAVGLPPELIRTMLNTEALGQHPIGKALVDDVAAYADELRLLGPFPFELAAEKFARSVCVDLIHAR